MARLLPWMYGELYKQKHNLLLWLPILLSIGIGSYFYLRSEPPFIVPACLAFFCALGTLLLYARRDKSALFYTLWLLCTVAAVIVSGFTIAQYRTMSLGTIMLQTKTGTTMISGRIIDIDRMEEGDGSRIILSDLDIEKLEPAVTPQKVRIRVKWDQNLRIGQRVEFLGAINAPSAPVAPHAFDFQRYAYFQGIGGFGFAFKEPTILEQNVPQSGPFNQTLEKIRQSILPILDKHMKNASARGVAAALITGERTSIPEDVWDDMRDSGMAHMLAISGLHVGMVAGVIFFFVRLCLVLIPRFAEKHPAKKYAALAAIIGALLYMLIVGSTIPTQRAMLMTTIVMLAVILDRKAFSMRLVALTAFIVLLITPEALWSASFQMSFAAVSMLVFFYDRIRNYWSSMYRNASFLRRFGLYIMGVSMTTVIATFATAPFALFHFQHLSVYSLFSNLIGVPIMAFIVMPLTAFSYLAMSIGLAAPVLWAMEHSIGFILYIAHSVSVIDGSTWNPPAWNMNALIMLVVAACLGMVVRGRLCLVAVLPLILCAYFTMSYTQPDILISSSGKLMAYRDDEAIMHFNSRSSDRFASDIWARRNGQEDKERWPYQQQDNNDMKCDSFGCYVERAGHKIAFSKHPQSHMNDCNTADIMIAEDPVFIKPCKAEIIIDKFYLWRNGATALRFANNGSIIVNNVEQDRGHRPWTISPRR